MFGCGRPAAAPPPKVEKKIVVSTQPVQPPPSVPEDLTPTAAERLEAFLKQLTPSTEPETLLLGIETVPSVGYGPLYGGDGSKVPPEDKLHTVVLHFHDGRAEFVGELPFLAIPQESGFLYMGVASYERDDTEAERKRQGPKFGLDDDVGAKVYWYAASSLWQTTDRAKVDKERNRERKYLEKQRKWGDFSGKDINYVTSLALCTTSSTGEWTGGAQAFMASEHQELTGLSKKLPTALSHYTDDAGLLQFARDIMREREPGEPDPEIDLDKPFDIGFSVEVDWRKDSHACLARRKGRVMLTGVIRLPNNGARSSEWETPVRDAPAELASNAIPTIALADAQRAFAVPRPLDIVVSPRKTALIAQLRDRYVVYGPSSPVPLVSIPLSGRIVMAEWASGDLANTWARVGDPPKASAPASCACDLGMICFENKCVKPKTVFVTSTLYTGNLGGLAGADAKCNERARIGGLGGDFKAWLSDSKTSAAERLTHATVPYVLVDGTVLAKDWADLVKGDLEMPIRLTEFVQWPTTVPHPPGCADSIVWTNTTEKGVIAAKNGSCHDWTDGNSGAHAEEKPVLGQTDSGWLWSSQCKSEYIGCNASYPLFCFEQ